MRRPAMQYMFLSGTPQMSLIDRFPERDRPYIYFFESEDRAVCLRDIRSGKAVQIPDEIKNNHDAIVAFAMVTLL